MGKPPCPVPKRGWSATLVWMRYCGTVAKAGGKQRTPTSSCSPGSLQSTHKASLTRVLDLSPHVSERTKPRANGSEGSSPSCSTP